jgi:hypothetical protein
MKARPKTANRILKAPARTNRDRQGGVVRQQGDPLHQASATAVAAEALMTGILPLCSDPRLRRHEMPHEDELKVGDPDDSTLENEYAGEDLPGSASPTPDQNNVDEIGRAYGVQDEDSGALRTSSEVMARRDRRRVELQPPGRPRT